MNHPHELDRLSQSECSTIVVLWQAVRSRRRVGRMLNVAPDTLDKIVCGRGRASASTIARVRASLVRLRVVAMPGVH